MAAMDLRTNQEIMGMQNRYPTEYGGHMFKEKDTFEEADIKGNNNLFNSLKTEAASNHSHDSSSLYEGKCSNKKKLEVDNSLFSYSSFKKAMDLRTHNRTLDGGKRTIFDDAEHFAKNHCYKLLPITFEHVDETIIQSEHNYSLFSLTSESEPEEDCSRMMDFSQIREKNYKRRRAKFRERNEEEPMECGTVDGHENDMAHTSPVMSEENENLTGEAECLDASLDLESENSAAAQPLDLSGPPLAEEEEKTDLPLLDSPEKIEEIARLDSDKENVGLELSGIRVTITRPDEKENYQPCDLFLNDIARLVPWLIDKDCLEVDILDRTCEGHDEFRKHRLYYVISEPTWRLFQTSNERIILTNDQSLGQPARKAEKGERPSFLVFDQFSLAKCLAEYCQEIGGCFEYTCVEEGREQEPPKEKSPDKVKEEAAVVEVEATGEVVEVEGIVEVKVPLEAEEEKKQEATEEVASDANAASSEAAEHRKAEIDTQEETGVRVERPEEEAPCAKEVAEEQEEEVEEIAEEQEEEVEEIAEKQSRVPEQVAAPKINEKQKGEKKTKKKEAKETKPRRTPPIQPKPKNSQITTRSKSTSESETSQKSDERVSTRGGRKRGGSALPAAEPPAKAKRAAVEPPPRRTRSGKVAEEAKPSKPSPAKRESARSAGSGRREAAEGAARSLRSQRVAQRQGGRGRTTATSKAKGRRR